MKRKAAFVVLVMVVLLGCIVVYGFGMHMKWWGYATTELGLLPDKSGGIVLHEPSRGDFSSDAAWDDYQEHWRDPLWDGEYPEGYRFKVASFVDEKRAGYAENKFVAGCVAWWFRGEATDGDASEIAQLVGVDEYYFVPSNVYGGEDPYVRTLLLLYFGDDSDIWDEQEKLNAAAEAVGWDDRGVAAVVHLQEIPNYLDRMTEEEPRSDR